MTQPGSVHIYDISGTGWHLDEYDTIEEYLRRVGDMNNDRVAAGLPPVTPLDAIPADILHKDPNLDIAVMNDEILAGGAVYLIDLSMPGAASAAYHADFDHDGVLGSLPAGRVVQLIDTAGHAAWRAETVEEVSALQGSIDWLVIAMNIPDLTEAPVHRDQHTVDPAAWSPAVTRRVLDALAAGDAVWTFSLEHPAAWELARGSGLPGFVTTDGGKTWTITPQVTADDLRDAFDLMQQRVQQAPPALPDPDVPVLVIEIDEAPTWKELHDGIHARGGRPDTVGEILENLARAGRQDGLTPAMVEEAQRRWRIAVAEEWGWGRAPVIGDYLRKTAAGRHEPDESTVRGSGKTDMTAETLRSAFTMFAWTDRDGCLQQGTIDDLVRDIQRRDREDHAAVANVYVMTPDAELVAVDWNIVVDPTPRVVVTLPDGGKLAQECTIARPRPGRIEWGPVGDRSDRWGFRPRS